VTNPASNLKLASGIAPIKRYLDEGIALAIGTDGPASNNCLDMFREMFLTTALAKVKEQDLYQNLIYYIEEHLEEELSLEKLAGAFFVSRYYVAHVFKEQAGISVHQYILKKRMQASREAILGGENISQVYERFGFRDYSSFYRAFRREYGMSPKEYREERLR